MSDFNDAVECAAAFLYPLFAPYADNGLRAEIRTIRDGRIEQSWYPLDNLELAARHAVQRRSFTNVYVGVLPRTGCGTMDKDVHTGAWLWADIDAGKVGPVISISSTDKMCMEMVEHADVPRPHMLVESGSGGAHLYWRLPAPEAVDTRYTGILSRLCYALGRTGPGPHADRACCNASRILRVPGTLNHKTDPPRPVEAYGNFAHVEHPLDWWDGCLPHIPIQYNPDPDGLFNRHQGLERWAERGHPEGARHHALAADAKWLKNDIGVHGDEGLMLLLTKARASVGTRWISEAEVREIWKWA